MRTQAVLRIGALAAALVLAAGCSSEKSTSGGTTPTTTPGTEVTTTVADTSAPSTEAPTTEAPTTAPTAAGWTEIDPDTVDAPLAIPCCASNWFNLTPSPDLPDPGQPLADGVYRIELSWPDDPSQPITATVKRFDQCLVLPAGSCEEIGMEYPPEDFGVDETSAYELTITLDNSVDVVLGGYTGFEVDNAGAFKTGTGLDLAELLTNLAADYDTAVLQPLAAGTTEEELVAQLVATPANGFGPPPDEGSGVLTYTYGSAPPLLLQYFPDTRGTDLIGPISLIVSGVQLQLQLYAGFYS